MLEIDGSRRRFYDYKARSIPYGPDDGTLAPGPSSHRCLSPGDCAAGDRHIDETYPDMMSEYGFKCSFNPTFRVPAGKRCWHSKGYYGLDQGPIVLMIENYRTGLLWRLMRRCRYSSRACAAPDSGMAGCQGRRDRKTQRCSSLTCGGDGHAEAEDPKIVRASRPVGEPTEDNFRLIEEGIADRPERGLLLKTLFLSLDPGMRGLMDEGVSYTPGLAIGGVMDGEL